MKISSAALMMLFNSPKKRLAMIKTPNTLTGINMAANIINFSCRLAI